MIRKRTLIFSELKQYSKYGLSTLYFTSEALQQVEGTKKKIKVIPSIFMKVETTWISMIG